MRLFGQLNTTLGRDDVLIHAPFNFAGPYTADQLNCAKRKFYGGSRSAITNGDGAGAFPLRITTACRLLLIDSVENTLGYSVVTLPSSPPPGFVAYVINLHVTDPVQFHTPSSESYELPAQKAGVLCFVASGLWCMQVKDYVLSAVASY